MAEPQVKPEPNFAIRQGLIDVFADDASTNVLADRAELGFRIATSSSIDEIDRAALIDGTMLTDMLGAGAPATLVIEDGRGVVDMPARTAGIYRAP